MGQVSEGCRLGGEIGWGPSRVVRAERELGLFGHIVPGAHEAGAGGRPGPGRRRPSPWRVHDPNALRNRVSAATGTLHE